MQHTSETKPEADIFSPAFIYPFTTVVYFTVGTPNFVQNFVIDVPVPWQIWMPIGVALCAFYLGLKISDRCFRHGPAIDKPWSPVRAKRFVLIVFLINAALTIYGFAVEGAPLLAGEGGEEMRMAYGQKVGGWISLCHLGVETCALIAAYLIIRRYKAGLRMDPVLVGILASAIAILVLTGIRTYLVFVVMGTTALYHYNVRRIRPARAMVLSAALLLAVGSIGFARIWFLQSGESWYGDELQRLGINPLVAPLAPLYLSFRSGAENLAFLYNAIPKQFDYFHGALLWRTFSVFWIRHQQLSASYLMERVFGLDPLVFGPVGATTVGTFWAEGGYIGIVLGFGVIGFTLQLFYMKMRQASSLFWQLCYVSVLCTCLIYVYGTFFGEINFFMRAFFMAVVSVGAAIRRRPEWLQLSS